MYNILSIVTLKIALAFLNVLLSWYVAEKINYDTWGIYASAIAISIGISSVFRLGLDSFVIEIDSSKSAPYNSQEIFSYFSFFVSFLLGISIFVQILYLSEYIMYIQLGLILAYVNLFSIVLKIKSRIKTAVILESGFLPFSLAISLLLLIYIGKENLLHNLLIVVFVFYVYSLAYSRPKFAQMNIVNFFCKNVKVLIKYSVNTILATSLQWLPIFIVQLKYDTTTTGEFALAYRFSFAIALMQAALASYFLPKIVNSIHSDSLRLVLQKMLLTAFALALISSCVLFVFYVSGSFLEAAITSEIALEIFKILAFAQIIGLLFPADGYVLIALKKSTELVIIQTIAIVILCMFAYITTSIIGVAIGLIAYLTFQKSATFYVVMRAT